MKTGTCALCDKPGSGNQITENCGYDDKGGRHEMPVKKCDNSTFNNGTGYFCEPCSSCPEDFITVTPCTAIADTTCSKQQTTTGSAKTNLGINKLPPESWAVLLTFIICTTLLSCLFIYRKRGYRKSTCPDVCPLCAVQETTELKGIFSPEILAAPLISVLDNLDVLEELIILLDPETQGIKNTKHLAALCSFSSNWVTYTYSLKESRSPLQSLLKEVTCRHPEWTVGSLAELLRQMERMDAVMALSKICPGKLDITDV